MPRFLQASLRESHRAQIPLAAVSIYLLLFVTALPAKLALGALLLATLYTTLLPEEKRFEPEPTQHSLLIALALFLASFAISTYFSYYRPVSMSTLSNLLPGLLIAYVLSRATYTSTAFAYCGALFAGAVVISYLLIALRSHWMNIEHAMAYFRTTALVVPNDAIAAVILLPALMAVALLSHSRLARTAALGVMVLAVPVLWWVGSRLSLLTLLLTLLVYGMLTCRVRAITALKGFTLLSIAACLAAVLITRGFENSSRLPILDNTRLSVWAAGISRWQDKPWVGVGPGHFEVPYRLGIAELKLPDWVMVEQRMVPWAHNIYLEAYLERGAIGLGTQLLLFGLLLRAFHRRWRQADNSARPFHLTVLLAYYAFLFAGLFELTFQRLWVANLFFLFVGAALAPVKNARGQQFQLQ